MSGSVLLLALDRNGFAFSTFVLKPSLNQVFKGYTKLYARKPFLKLWFKDHKWSSGSALVVLLD